MKTPATRKAKSLPVCVLLACASLGTAATLAAWTTQPAPARSHKEEKQVGQPAAAAEMPSIAVPAEALPTQPTETVVHPCPRGASLFVPPVLEPGKSAWVTVQDAAGEPLSGVSVMVNGSPVQTTSAGTASFTVPRTAAVALLLIDPDGAKSCQQTYELSPQGFFTSARSSESACDKLLATTGKLKLPTVLYAPLVVAPGQRLVLIGRNFSGKPDEDKATIDGAEALILSGSSTSLLVQAPQRLTPAPLRALTVQAGGLSANQLECDTVTVSLELDAQKKKGKSKSRQVEPKASAGQVLVVGTDLPCLVKISNESAQECQLTCGEQTTSNQSCTVVTPGGEQNRLALNVTTTGTSLPTLVPTLLSDAPDLDNNDSQTLSLPRGAQVIFDLRRAEIIKIKRRLVAVEARLTEARAHVEKMSGLEDAASRSKAENDIKALSGRQLTLTHMLAARRALLEAAGAPEKVFLETLDEATGGGYYLSEKQVQGLAYTSPNPLLDETISKTSEPDRRSPIWRYRNLPIPAIKLLPPRDWQTRFGFAPVNEQPNQPREPRSAASTPAPPSKPAIKYNEYGQPLPTDNPQEPRIETLQKTALPKAKAREAKGAVKKEHAPGKGQPKMKSKKRQREHPSKRSRHRRRRHR